jgi:hypothetical protein
VVSDMRRRHVDSLADRCIDGLTLEQAGLSRLLAARVRLTGLCGEIIARFEKKGYKLVAAKVLVPGEETAKAHYAEHDGKPFFPKLVTFLTSGPVRKRNEMKHARYLIVT